MLGEFIRTQAIVSLVDAMLIGIGLLVLGVPLALPLAVLTFIGGFIPIVGAVVAGVLGVLVALVSNGFTTALIVLAIIIAVQQLEGNVLQPMLQSRSLGLHAVVVLLAVTAGSTLYGIAGAFLSVPVAAAGAVVLRYLSERVDARAAGGPAPRVDPPLETVQTVIGTPGSPTPDATRPDPDADPPPGPGPLHRGRHRPRGRRLCPGRHHPRQRSPTSRPAARDVGSAAGGVAAIHG